MQTKREWLNTARREWPSFMIIFRNTGANLSSQKWNDDLNDEMTSYKEKVKEDPKAVVQEYNLKGIAPPLFQWHGPDQDYHAFPDSAAKTGQGADEATVEENKRKHALTLGQHLSNLLRDEDIDELHHYFQLATEAVGVEEGRNTRGWPEYGLFLDMASDLPEKDEPDDKEIDEAEQETNRVRQRALGINTKGTVIDDPEKAPLAHPLAEGEPSHPVVAGSEGVRKETSVPRNASTLGEVPNSGVLPSGTSAKAATTAAAPTKGGEKVVTGADGKPADGSNVKTSSTGAGKPSGSSTSQSTKRG